QRNPYGLEVLRSNAPHTGLRSLSRLGLGTAFDPEIAADVSAAKRHRGHERRAFNPRQRSQLFERLADIPYPLVGPLIYGPGKTDPRTQHVLGIEARIYVYQHPKTTNHQAGTDEQYQAQSDFGNNKRV